LPFITTFPSVLPDRSIALKKSPQVEEELSFSECWDANSDDDSYKVYSNHLDSESQ